MSDSSQKTLSAFELISAARLIRQIAADLGQLSRGDYEELERIAVALALFSRQIEVIEQRTGPVVARSGVLA